MERQMDCRRTEIGVNTFGLGKLLSKDFEGTVRQLKEAGFTAVEPLVIFPSAMGMPEAAMEMRLASSGQLGTFWPETIAEKRIRYLRDEGFRVEGIHLGLAGMIPGGLKQAAPYAAAFARKMGLSYVVHSPKRTNAEEMKQEAEGFRSAKEILDACGCELLFHCHYHEFAEDQGTTPFDYLLREVPDLPVELDVGWVHYAGRDVIELIRTYAGRIRLIHFKDYIRDEQNTCFTAIGEGVLPLKEIAELTETLDLGYVRYIIDQDDSRGDMMRDLKKGAENIRLLIGEN